MEIWKTERAKPFTPEIGKVYKNAGGGEFMCVYGSYPTGSPPTQEKAWFINVKSHWMFLAHWIHIYSDGSIDWDYSKQGTFVGETTWEPWEEEA